MTKSTDNWKIRFREHVAHGEFWEIIEGRIDLTLLESFIESELTRQREEMVKRLKKKMYWMEDEFGRNVGWIAEDDILKSLEGS